MLLSVDMLLLSVTFIYTGWYVLFSQPPPHTHIHTYTHTHTHTHKHTPGYELNFWSGVYGTAVGETNIYSTKDSIAEISVHIMCYCFQIPNRRADTIIFSSQRWPSRTVHWDW